MNEITARIMNSINAEVYNSDESSSCTNSPVERVNKEVLVNPDQCKEIISQVTQTFEELKILREMCSLQQKGLESLTLELKETKEELKETKETLSTEQKRIWLLNHAMKCDRFSRSEFIKYCGSSKIEPEGRVGLPTPDIDLPHLRPNAVADALVYLETSRNDSSVFSSLYGLSWQEVLKIGTTETLRVVNTFARAQLGKKATQHFMYTAKAFFETYLQSSEKLRLEYPSQLHSPLRLAYVEFLWEHRKLTPTGHAAYCALRSWKKALI